MTELKVGQPFSERKSWRHNSFELRYASGLFLLQLCFPSPPEREIKAFSEGAMHIALYCEQNVIFFCFRINNCMDWSDQAFSIQLIHEEDRDIPDTGNAYVPLSLVLVDADTGIIRALRMVTMTPLFASAFKKRLQIQKDTPFSREEHFATVERIYRRYPTSRHIVRASLLQECAGKTI